MAELILTDAEREVASYYDWDDATLGRAVKRLAIMVQDDARKRDALDFYSAMLVLIAVMKRRNADEMFVSICDVTLDFNAQSVGDYKLKVIRTDRAFWLRKLWLKLTFRWNTEHLHDAGTLRPPKRGEQEQGENP